MQVDERYYNNYVENDPLDSQIELLNKLEAMGWEKDEDRILTTRKFGVPTTSILLLMKEAADEIADIQKEFYCKRRNEKMKDDDLKRNYAIKINPDKIKENRIWGGKTSCELDEQYTVSGSGNYTFSYDIYPESYENFPISSYIESDDPKVTVESKFIRVRLNESIPLIKIYKATFQFHEFSYVLKERIEKNEIAVFERKTEKKLCVTEIGRIFQGNVGRRGAIIHGSYFGFSIGDDLTIRISEKKLTEITRKGLNEAICWVDLVYKKMLNIIKRGEGV